MATVGELSDPYAHFMLNPLRPWEENVCSVCLTFTEGYDTCYPCGWHGRYADRAVAVSYSIHFGQLHTALGGYKRGVGPAAVKLQNELAAVLWRFLAAHERCLARSVGVEAFDLVTTVPSGSVERDNEHPLRRIVGKVVGPTKDRYEHLLVRSGVEVSDRTVDPAKYTATRELSGEAVLLIDDTWTTGASAQSAAGALKQRGAGPVGVVVIGRHIHEDRHDYGSRLAEIPRPFDWDRCALELD
jgi:hypothetical protein